MVSGPLAALTTTTTASTASRTESVRPKHIRISGGVQQMDARRVAIEGEHGGLEGVPQLPLLRIEIRHGVAARQAPLRPDGARLQQQALRQQRLARAGRSDQRDISDARGRMAHVSLPRQRVAAVSGARRHPETYSAPPPMCSPARYMRRMRPRPESRGNPMSTCKLRIRPKADAHAGSTRRRRTATPRPKWCLGSAGFHRARWGRGQKGDQAVLFYEDDCLR